MVALSLTPGGEYGVTMHAFTIENRGSSVRHVALAPDAKTKLSGKFLASLTKLEEKRATLVDYDPGYTPGPNEMFEVAWQLPSTLEGLVERVPARFPRLKAEDIERERPQAVLVALGGARKLLCFQGIDSRNFLRPRGKWTTLLAGGGTFEVFTGAALNVSERVDAFYENGKLYFHSEFVVRRFLDLDTVFAPMKLSQVRELLSRDEFDVANMEQVLEHATDLYRRKLARIARVLGDGGIDVKAVQRAANALSSQVPGLSVTVRRNKIVVPEDKKGFTELVHLLNDDYLQSTVNRERFFFTNSKRSVGGAARVRSGMTGT